MNKAFVDIRSVPQKPGVYLFKDKGNEIIYIGKSVNLRRRIREYLTLRKTLGGKTQKMVSEIASCDLRIVQSDIEALLLETSLIKKHKPKYNVIWKDDKSHLYIKITLSSEVPQVTTARRQPELPGVKLYGPFASASQVRRVLRTLRRVFPYCQHTSSQKNCLWVHLGLCPDPYRSDRGTYKDTIKNLSLFLEGKNSAFSAQLKKAVKSAVKEERFEAAASFQRQLEALQYVTSSYITPEEYLKSPTLLEDTVKERLGDVQNVLKLSRIPKRIEAYDISNIQGQKATGSMVVFINGQKDTREYRKFRIRTEDTPNDTAMVREVMRRRLKNNWPLPDLILVDGGRGQLNAVLAVLTENNLNLPVIGLAKREEEIYEPDIEKPLKLKSTSGALQLLREMRDEAHRFALKYHKKLRSRLVFDQS